MFIAVVVKRCGTPLCVLVAVDACTTQFGLGVSLYVGMRPHAYVRIAELGLQRIRNLAGSLVPFRFPPVRTHPPARENHGIPLV